MPDISEQIMAHAAAMRQQANEMVDTAERIAALADPEMAKCDHENDSRTDRIWYWDTDDGITAYAGIERCDRCGAERAAVVFPDEARAGGVHDVYYSDWTPAMTEARQKQALGDIIGQILEDAFRHAQATQTE